MFRRCCAFAFAVLAWLLVTLAASEASAQRMEMVKLNGKVKASDKNSITIAGAMDIDVVVRVNQRGSRASVEGTAVREYLAPGINVQFVADATNAGVIPQPLPEITICTFTDSEQPTFSPDDPTLPTQKGKDAINKYLVRGTIKFFRKDELTITIPGKTNVLPNGKPAPATPAKTIKATLAPDAMIKVAVSDVSWAQPGDEASVQGMVLPSGDVMARSLTVTLAKPLEPKPAAGSKSKKAAAS